MFEKLKAIIEKNDVITIFGHIFPDGDCYGSQIALKHAILENYPSKKVYVVGSGLRRFFDFIDTMDDVSDDTIKNSLGILVDGNDFSRAEDQRISLCKEWIKIDHHVENGLFTQGEFVVDEDANSTCQLVLELILECGWKINKTAANALYLGILTDTGRFQFIEDYPRAFKEIYYLSEHGADPKTINEILNVTSENLLAFKGYVCSHYQKTDNGVIYLILNQKVLSKYQISASKAGSMIYLLGNIEGFPIWAIFAENENGSMHIEFRSNGPAVQPVADSIGGGGHALAAGATLNKFDKNEIIKIVKMLDNVIIEYRKECLLCGKKN